MAKRSTKTPDFEAALAELEAHARDMEERFRLVARSPLPAGLNGHYMAPVAFEIDSIRSLEKEVFGPVLHIVRFSSRELDRVVDDINAAGYGLTLGVHSRIDRVQRYIARRVEAGNCYVNRNMIGAVVGVVINLAVFFAWHVLWPEATEAEPFSGRFDWFSLLITVAAFLALWRFRAGIISVVAGCAVIGLGWSLITA
mgnify:CR=1 FL=1